MVGVSRRGLRILSDSASCRLTQGHHPAHSSLKICEACYRLYCHGRNVSIELLMTVSHRNIVVLDTKGELVF